MNKVWNMVQKIKGKNNKTNVHHLKDGHDTLTSEQDISNNLETKLRQAVRRFCFNVLRPFALKMRKLPRLSDVGCFSNRRSAFLRFLMAVEVIIFPLS
jgi:hypothetical protein